MNARYGIDVLAFGPHPDDLELFCGGTIARLVSLGYRVGLVDLTRGELATHGTPEGRKAEAAEAADILGVSWRENLGLPDGFVSAGSGHEDPTSPAASQLTRVVEVLRRQRPELVLMPWIEERHPDHAAAGALLTRALFYAGLQKFAPELGLERFAPRQALHYELRHRMAPSFIVDTSPVIETKQRAIACYRSQLHRGPGEVQTLVGSARAVEAIDARDRFYGSMIGTSHGEPLRAPNALGLVDPLAHFRANAFSGAHFFEALR